MTGPWSPGIVRGCVVTTGLAGAGVVSGWAGVSAHTTTAGQVPWLNVAVVAVAAAAATGAAWLLAGRQHLITRRRDLLTLPGRASSAGPASHSGWVHVTGTSRGHRPNCLLVQGKQTVPLTRSLADAQHLVPCEVCT